MASITSCTFACNAMSGMGPRGLKLGSKPSMGVTKRLLPTFNFKAQAHNSTEEKVDTAKRASLFGLLAASLVATPLFPALAEITKDDLEKSGCVVKYGPFGEQTGGKDWFIALDPSEDIKELNMRTGAIVDSIEFVTTSTTICGADEHSRKGGGQGGNVQPKVTFKKGEYVTKVSGANATWNRGGGNVRGIARLKIHTNLNPDGYGPYGGTSFTSDFSPFSSSIPATGRVVGLSGTLVEDQFLQSIQIYFAKRPE